MNKNLAKQIIKDSLYYPSGDNAQPFSFEWIGDGVRVHHESSRARHVFNPQFFASWISLGALLELININSAVHGYLVDYKLLPELGAQLTWKQSESIKVNPLLVESIKKRATDRRVYKGKSIETSTIDLIKKLGQGKNSKLHWLEGVSPQLLSYILDADQFLWETKPAMDDLISWVRFSKEEAANTRDGMPAANLGLNPIVTKIFKAAYGPGLVGKLCYNLARTGARETLKKQIKSSAGLMAFTVNEYTPQALVELGGRAMKVWLQLTVSGCSAQPLSLAPFGIFWQRFSLNSEFMNERWQSLFSEGYHIFSEELGLSSHEVPVWLLRTGPMDPLPQAARTFRLDVEDVFDFKKEGAEEFAEAMPKKISL